MVKQWNKVQPLCLQCRRFNLWLNLFLLALSTSRSAAICSSISLIDTVYILLVISVFTELQWLHICLRLQEIGVSKTLLLELSVYQCYEDETISLKWPFFFFLWSSMFFSQRYKTPDLHSICGQLWCLGLFFT